MYYCEISVESNCGVASLSDHINGRIMTIGVAQQNDGLNHIVAISAKNSKFENYEYSNKEFLHFIVHTYQNFYAFFITKKGHGIISSLRIYGAIPVFPILTENGSERFTFFCPTRENLDQIINNLNKVNNIRSVEFYNVENYNYESMFLNRTFSEGLLGLTKTESNLLKTAYFEGFFNWPKDVNLTTLSSKFKISNVASDRHIRNGVRKILKHLFEP